MKILSFVSNKKQSAAAGGQSILQEGFAQADLELAIMNWLSGQLGIPETDIDADVHMSDLGMDSLLAADLSAFVEQITGVATADEVAWQFPTVKQLADYVMQTRNGTW